jgi:hypothetical protein
VAELGDPFLTHQDSIVGLWRSFLPSSTSLIIRQGARRYVTILDAALFHRCDEKVFVPSRLSTDARQGGRSAFSSNVEIAAKSGFQRSTGGGLFPSAAALLSAPVIAPRPDCRAFAVIRLELCARQPHLRIAIALRRGHVARSL